MWLIPYSVSMSEALASIKSNIALFTRDVSGLQGEERAGAVSYIQDTINLLRLGAVQQFPPRNIKLDEEATTVKMETKASFETITSILYKGVVPICDKCGQSFPSVGAMDTHMKQCKNDISTTNDSKSSEDLVAKLD